MKHLRTIAVTLGVGSALAWLAGNRNRRSRIIAKGKSRIQEILRDENPDDDNTMRYI